MTQHPYLPVLELTRGEAVESVHYGAFAVVDSRGQLVASWGNPDAVTFLRSSMKPFQALPFIEAGGHLRLALSPRQVAILCASHAGTDDHFEVLSRIQARIGVSQDDLLCGVHPPADDATRDAMIRRGEEPTPNRHNCSGKHTGMLAFCRLTGETIEDYIGPGHPVQQQILQTFMEMCRVTPGEIARGIDGCSAPVFAIPLRNAALGYARLCDPHDLSPQRAEACRVITAAMTAHPGMVAGPGKFDTRLMAATGGKIVSKGGAEGYQQVGIMPGAIAPGSPGLGMALKVSDGDPRGRARPAVTLEILRQLGALTPAELEDLSEFGPRFPVTNWRKIVIGEAYPVFGENRKVDR